MSVNLMGGVMAVQLPCTFLIKGDRYDLIGVAGGDILTPMQFGTPPRGLHTARHATYELTMDALYLIALTFKEENVYYLPVGEIGPCQDSSQTTYQGLSMVIPFTGKIRLAKDFIKEPYIHMGYQKAIAFKTVLDVALQDGEVAEVKNRSWEMGQKRDALKKCHESANRLENMGYRKAVAFKTVPRTAQQDRRVIEDRWEGIEQKSCALREYYESAARLKKVLYAYSLDLELE
jgi:hypothetical protein